MDYEKAYKETLKRARISRQQLLDIGEEAIEIEHIFPELVESEDEQHSKWILEYLYDGLRKSDEQFKGQFNSAISWLEKQKPINIDYENAFDEFISHIPEKDPDSSNSLYTYEDIEAAIKFGIQWHKQQKPAWSEEDEKICEKLLFLMEEENSIEYWEGCYEWLKSLKDRLKGE